MDGGLQKELMTEARFDRGASESNGSLRQNTPNGESTISLTYWSKTPSVRSIWSYSSVMVVDLFLLLFDWKVSQIDGDVSGHYSSFNLKLRGPSSTMSWHEIPQARSLTNWCHYQCQLALIVKLVTQLKSQCLTSD
jgi:hypothetical protein